MTTSPATQFAENLKYPTSIPHCAVAALPPSGATPMELEQRIKQFEEHPELRFVKVQFRSKRPLERDWVNKPYTYSEILPHIQKPGNYGLLCGHGGLAVPDADEPELEAIIQEHLPPTFTVQTGSGGKHFYYICREIQKRILLERDGKHYGEVQSRGQMVVGPGSMHPSGNRYVISKTLPIVEVSYDDMVNALRPFVKERKHHESVQTQTSRPAFVFDINSIPLTDIIDVSQYKLAANGELYGPNPWHGSTTGMNFFISPGKNVAYCFRHCAGITVAKAIALNEKIIHECDAQLTRDQFIQVLRVAEKEYGLRR